jgi:ABC-2 type transport system permease protein
MLTEFKHTLRRLRGGILGWGIGLFLYDLYISSFYSSIGGMSDEYMHLISQYPPDLMAFIPVDEIGTPTGYIATVFSNYIAIILGIFAISACAKLVVGDEENGILDLVMAHPIKRTSLFWGRFLGYVTALVLILLSSWVGWLIPGESSGLDLTAVEFMMPFLPLFAVLVFFGALTLLLSLLMPSARAGSGLVAAILVANYLLIGLSNINEDLKPLYEVTPLYFHQGAQAINDFNEGWFFGLLGAGTILALLAWWIFTRRDIRVGGEAGWKVPLLKLRRKK